MSLLGTALRNEFPQLNIKVHDKPLVYLDSAASSLKAAKVVDRVNEYNRFETSNVHRGIHWLSQKGTENYEKARETIASFLNAKSPNEIIFTRGTTESANLVAYSYARHFLQAGDEILLTELEHHSTIIPWQVVAQEKSLKIKVVPITEEGNLDLVKLEELLTKKTKLVAMQSSSNVFGSDNDIKLISEKAHANGAKVFVDAAQTPSHKPIDVQSLNCDFLAFSGHKVFGPYGIGVLYAKESLLNEMPPYQTGGSMISEVHFEESKYLQAPQRFEAGTPNVSGAIGLATAVQFVQNLGYDQIQFHNKELIKALFDELGQIDDIEIHGPKNRSSAIFSFNIKGIHASDIGSIIDNEGIAIRTGHHCCQPLMRRLGVTASCRASFSIYNTLEEVELLKKALVKAKGFF